MSPSLMRVEILSPTLVEVTLPSHQLTALSEFYSDRGLLAMRQSDCVMVEGNWRAILLALVAFCGDPCLGETIDQAAEAESYATVCN
ncbi:hypothetical protein GC163_13045 [bacterium]|nr:hypothetical protein [bacterium]